MKQMKAVIFDIQHFSISDGPGIRTTVFLKGCNLKCAWCHNPESQSFEKQMLFYKDKCTFCGKCKEVCRYHLEKCDFCGKCVLFCPNDARKICGMEMTVDEVFTEILNDKTFYDNSGGGVTFSGGECMLQIEFLSEILKKCKDHHIHTAVDTAGNVAFEKFEKILPYTDMFLYDIKCMSTEKHKRNVGVGNKVILDNLSELLELKATVWVRIPFIAGVNDNDDEMQMIKEYYNKNGYPEKTEFLPYHAIGEQKYSALSREAHRFEAPSQEKLNRYMKLLQF